MCFISKAEKAKLEERIEALEKEMTDLKSRKLEDLTRRKEKQPTAAEVLSQWLFGEERENK